MSGRVHLANREQVGCKTLIEGSSVTNRFLRASHHDIDAWKVAAGVLEGGQTRGVRKGFGVGL
jgi:hypothetical protein